MNKLDKVVEDLSKLKLETKMNKTFERIELTFCSRRVSKSGYVWSTWEVEDPEIALAIGEFGAEVFKDKYINVCLRGASADIHLEPYMTYNMDLHLKKAKNGVIYISFTRESFKRIVNLSDLRSQN